MTYTPLSPQAAAKRIEELVAVRGPLSCSQLVFFGGMTDAAVKRGIRYLQEATGAPPDDRNTAIEIPSNLKVGLTPLIEDLETYQRALSFLETLFSEISGPDNDFNQNFVTPDTSVRRILYAATRDRLAGKRLYFLGDDDLTSVVAAYLYPDAEVFVLDVDQQLLSSIMSCAHRHGLSNINILQYNAFDTLPAHLHGVADAVWCDPSKAVLDVFLKIASTLTHEDGVVYTFAQPEYLPVDRVFFDVMLKHNLIATDVIPRFNQYCGGGQHSRMQAISEMFQLAFTESLVRLIKLAK